MKIKKFRLQRFRSLRDVIIEGLGPLTILMGASGSGKTSVIEALQMFTHKRLADGSSPSGPTI